MKNHLRKTTSGWILLTVVLPWLLTRSGLAADKFKVILHRPRGNRDLRAST